MTDDYQPSFARQGGGFDGPDDYPEGFQYGGGLTHTDNWEPTQIGSETTVQEGPPTFGDERHPSIIVTQLGEFSISSNNPIIHRCDHSHPVRYVIGLPVDSIPSPLIDAEKKGGTVELGIFGTREGDVETQLEAEVTDIRAASNGGAIIEFTLPPGEIGALYRWLATGCLVCRGEP